MKRYMLDTNTVSHLIRSHPLVSRRILNVPMAALCISAITEAELFYGLAKRPNAVRLHHAVRELLKRVDALPWNSAIAKTYGTARAMLEGQGKMLAPLDLLIAAHAMSIQSILVTRDKTFRQFGGLEVEDWTEAAQGA